MSSAPKPSWFVRTLRFVFRALLLTVLFAMLGMGVGLALGIVGTLIVAAVRHHPPDLTMAYRDVAIPLAVLSGASMLFYIVLSSARQALRTKQ